MAQGHSRPCDPTYTAGVAGKKENACPTGFYDALRPFGDIASKALAYWRPELLECLQDSLLQNFISDCILSMEKESGGGLRLEGLAMFSVGKWVIVLYWIVQNSLMGPGTIWETLPSA
jgi:hypothetical protein